MGIDVDNEMVDTKRMFGLYLNRNQADIDDVISNFSNGYGVDSVIITAGTSSEDPINFAGKVCRQRGRVVVVGAIPTGFQRENYYMK